MKTRLLGFLAPFRHYPRLFRLAFKTRPWDFFLLMFFTLGGAFLPMLTVYATEALVRQVQTMIGRFEDLSEILRSGVGGATMALIASLVLRNLFASYQDAFGRSVVYWMDLGVSARINARLLDMDTAFFDSAKRLDELKSAENAVDHPYQIVTRMFGLLGSLVMVIGMGALAAKFSIGLPFALVVLSIPGAVLSSRFNKRIHWLNVQLSPAFRKDDYFSGLMRDAKHAAEIRLSRAGSFIFELWERGRRSIALSRSRVFLAKSIAQSIADAATFLVLAVAWAFIAVQTIQGKVSLSWFVASIQIINNLMSSMAAIFNDAAVVIDSNAYLSDAFKIIDLREEEYEGALRPSRTSVAIVLHAAKAERIEVRNVSFRYPGSGSYVLQNISFELERDTITAIVGKNGAGKSTLAKLLCRVYDPSEGEILINGIDIREFPKAAFYDLVSVMFQDFARYELTVAQNVGMGNLSRMGERVSIERALDNAEALNLVQGLPAGIDQQLGKLFGSPGDPTSECELSVGQWQKIALARAYLKEEAPLLVLDEPSSSMDALGELKLVDRLFALARGRITCVISHRFTTVRACAKIIVMDAGRIVESGTHIELARSGKLYTELCAAQEKLFGQRSV